MQKTRGCWPLFHHHLFSLAVLFASCIGAPMYAQAAAVFEKSMGSGLAAFTPNAIINLPPIQIGNGAFESVYRESTQAWGLSELVQQSIASSLQLRQAQAQYAAAAARAQVARADLLPNLSTRLSVGPEESQTVGTSPDRHEQRLATVRLTQTLYNQPLMREWSNQQALEKAAANRLSAVKETVALATVKAYLELTVARLGLDFSNEQLSQLTNLLLYLETRANAGASSQVDLERARTRSYNARQTRIEIQTTYRNALYELNRLTNSKPAALKLPSSQLFMQAANPIDWQKTLLSQSPELSALTQEITAQEHAVRAEQSRYLPVIGISLEHDVSENLQITSKRHTDTRGLLVMSWSASLGGREWYSTKQAQAELLNRQARLEDESQRAIQATEADWALLESSSLRIRNAEMEEESARKVVDAMTEQLQIGRMGSILEALDASERHFFARQRLVQALSQTLKARAQTLSRMGQLVQSSYVEISNNSSALPTNARLKNAPLASTDLLSTDPIDR